MPVGLASRTTNDFGMLIASVWDNLNDGIPEYPIVVFQTK